MSSGSGESGAAWPIRMGPGRREGEANDNLRHSIQCTLAPDVAAGAAGAPAPIVRKPSDAVGHSPKAHIIRRRVAALLSGPQVLYVAPELKAQPVAQEKGGARMPKPDIDSLKRIESALRRSMDAINRDQWEFCDEFRDIDGQVDDAPLLEYRHQGLIVDDIAESNMWVQLPGFKIPVRLHRAAMHNLLNHIRKQRWLEIMDDERDLLGLSERGEHFVHLRYKKGSKVPELVSTSLFHPINTSDPKGNPGQNLCLDPFFLKGWTTPFDQRLITDEIEQYARSRNIEPNDFFRMKGINFDRLPKQGGSLRDFLLPFIEAIEPPGQRIETLRYVFSPGTLENARRLFPFSVGLNAQTFVARHPDIDAVFVIGERPLVSVMEKFGDLCKSPCHLTLAQKEVKGVQTYQMIIFPKNIAAASKMQEETAMMRTNRDG